MTFFLATKFLINKFAFDLRWKQVFNEYTAQMAESKIQLIVRF